MSILIKGLKMPTIHEGQMIIRIEPSGKADVQWSGMVGGEYTKAVELPDHGDLIDRNKLMMKMWGANAYASNQRSCNVRVVFVKDIEDAPVVIPAERSEE